MQGWITQPGFPLINVSANGTSVEQSRYYDWGGSVGDDPFVTSSGDAWYVPLGTGQLASPNSPEDGADQWQEILEQSGVITSANLEGTVLNAGGSGYYRYGTVKYAI